MTLNNYDIIDVTLNDIQFIPYKIRKCYKIINRLSIRITKYEKLYHKIFIRTLTHSSPALDNKHIRVKSKLAKLTKRRSKYIETISEQVGTHFNYMDENIKDSDIIVDGKIINEEPVFINTRISKGALEGVGKTYCKCQGKAYGEMVYCEGKDCPYGWFHLQCEGLSRVPKGNFYCKSCENELYLYL